MYKNFYETEIKKISKILEEENIHIVEKQLDFKKYIYSEFNAVTVCKNLILTLDKNPKCMTLINLEKIKKCIEYNYNKPEHFSLKSDFFTEDGLVSEKIDYDLFRLHPNQVIITIDTEYKKSEYCENFNVDITKHKKFYSNLVMSSVNNILGNLEREFGIDLSDKKFDLSYEKPVLMETWDKVYNSPIFGEYTLKFKIYEDNHVYSIEIENSLTNNIYKIKDGFSSYGDAVDWMGHIKDTLIPLNNEDLEERISI